MKLSFSPIAFMLAYCLAYGLCLRFDYPAFRYYPLDSYFVWGTATVKGHGPAMAWYGILAYAVLAGTVAGLLIPNRWLEKPLRNLAWLVPVALMLTSMFLMRKFFA